MTPARPTPTTFKGKHEVERGREEIGKVVRNHVPYVGSSMLQDLDLCITKGLIGGEHVIQQPVLGTHERPNSESASGGSRDISGPAERGRPEQQEPYRPNRRARESHGERLAPSGRVASDEEWLTVHPIEGGQDSFVGSILVVPVRVIAVRSRWLAVLPFAAPSQLEASIRTPGTLEERNTPEAM